MLHFLTLVKSVILKDKIYFIAATGTNIGKTYFLEKIASKLRKMDIAFSAVKPVISGFKEDDLNSDSAKILQLLQQKLNKENFDNISPWRFEAALSPNIAGALEGKKIDFDQVVNFCRDKISESLKLEQFLFIESAGGIMTPITDDKTFLDLASDLQIPVLLLSSNYLGTISHSLCAIEALKARDIKPELILINNYSQDENKTDISKIVKTIENLSNIKTISFDVFLD